MTKAEVILLSRLRSKQVNGYKFRRQQPLLNYIVDFYCDELKLIIEVDGEIHSSQNINNHDLKRDNILKKNGYNIIHLTNLEVETEIDSTVNKIVSIINNILSTSREKNTETEE
jgi:very-short-patch-repair endonuclease